MEVSEHGGTVNVYDQQTETTVLVAHVIATNETVVLVDGAKVWPPPPVKEE